MPCHNLHPRLDGYNIVLKGTVPSDILVGYCKGPNQSVPSNYGRKSKLLFLETSSNSIPISRSHKAWWQVFGLCSGNFLVVSSLTGVSLSGQSLACLPEEASTCMCLLFSVITTASRGRCICKAEYIHSLVILQNQLKILCLEYVSPWTVISYDYDFFSGMDQFWLGFD